MNNDKEAHKPFSPFDKITQTVLKILPNKIIRHYLYPFLFRRSKIPYNPKEYFNSWYVMLDGKIEDGTTISHNFNPLLTKYHYNAAENSIIEFFLKHPVKKFESVLDIGSGAGHWIDFYLKVFGAGKVTGIEISSIAANFLKEKYTGVPEVVVHTGDVSQLDFSLHCSYDLVNAIGVLFHIVNDDTWEQAIQHISVVLKSGGYFVAGDQFGNISRNVQFHNQDRFSKEQHLISYTRFKDIVQDNKKPFLVNKKIRSMGLYKKVCKKYGLVLSDIIRTKENKQFVTPENNIAVFRKL